VRANYRASVGYRRLRAAGQEHLYKTQKFGRAIIVYVQKIQIWFVFEHWARFKPSKRNIQIWLLLDFTMGLWKFDFSPKIHMDLRSVSKTGTTTYCRLMTCLAPLQGWVVNPLSLTSCMRKNPSIIRKSNIITFGVTVGYFNRWNI
jgi:hypothetical protein